MTEPTSLTPEQIVAAVDAGRAALLRRAELMTGIAEMQAELIEVNARIVAFPNIALVAEQLLALQAELAGQ